VSVGVEQWDPIVFSNSGIDIDGIAGDYVKKIIEKSGLKIRVINDEWDNLLRDFKAQQIDLLPATYYTDERATYGLYSAGYFKMKEYIYVNEDNKNIRSFGDLNGKKLAIVKGYGTIAKVQAKYPSIQLVLTNDLDDSINRVLNGEVDALYEGQVVVEKKIEDELISGLKGIAQSSFTAPTLHLFSKQTEPLLQSILQKTLNSISFDEKKTIHLKWLSQLADEKDEPKTKSLIANLSREETAWINEHRIIKTAGEMDWPPFDYVDENGNYQGIANDYLKKIEKLTGLEFDVHTGLSWNEILEKGKSKELDLLPVAYFTKDRLKHFNYTKPYLNLNHYIFMRENEGDDVSRITDLKGKRLAMVKGYATEVLVKKIIPDIEIVYVKNVTEALHSIILNESDTYIEILPVVKYAINKNVIEGIKPVAIADLDNVKLHMMSRKDYELLPSILQKAMDAISHQEYQNIINKWMGGVSNISPDNELNIAFHFDRPPYMFWEALS